MSVEGFIVKEIRVFVGRFQMSPIGLRYSLGENGHQDVLLGSVSTTSEEQTLEKSNREHHV